MSMSPSRRRRLIEYPLAKAFAFAVEEAAAEAAAKAALEAAAAETAAAKAEARAKIEALENAKLRAKIETDRAFAVNNYRRADGTLVREHIRRGLPVIHSVYGPGFVRVPSYYDRDVTMIDFFPATAAGKKLGALFPVAKAGLTPVFVRGRTPHALAA